MTTLLIAGGGSYGWSYIGALESLDISLFTRYAGVSIGSFISLLLIIGFTPQEMKNLLKKTPIQSLFDYDLFNIMETYGLISIKKLDDFISMILKSRGFSENITFREIYLKTLRNIEIYCVNINTTKLEIFNIANTPDCPIKKAVLMSMSIPLLLPPISYNDCLYVDGALMNNFPIELYDQKDTIGICCLLSESNKKITSLTDYITNLISSTSKVFIKHKNTCYINCDNFHPLDIELTTIQINKLISNGFQAMKKFTNKSQRRKSL